MFRDKHIVVFEGRGRGVYSNKSTFDRNVVLFLL